MRRRRYQLLLLLAECLGLKRHVRLPASAKSQLKGAQGTSLGFCCMTSASLVLLLLLLLLLLTLLFLWSSVFAVLLVQGSWRRACCGSDQHACVQVLPCMGTGGAKAAMKVKVLSCTSCNGPGRWDCVLMRSIMNDHGALYELAIMWH